MRSTLRSRRPPAAAGRRRLVLRVERRAAIRAALATLALALACGRLTRAPDAGAQSASGAVPAADAVAAPAAVAGARRHAAPATPPLALRVGLASDQRAVTLCCDPRVTVTVGGDTLALSAAVRIEPAASLRGKATYRVQVAALKDEQQAYGIAEYLRRETRQTTDVVFDAGRDLYRVRFGRFDQRAEADAARGRLSALGIDQGWVVSEGGQLENAALRVNQAGRERRLEGRTLRLEAPAEVGIPFAQGRYRTRLLVYLNDRGLLNVINELSIEDYLRGVVPREMGPELYDQLEALKAQTVAARTFTVRNLGEFRDEGFDICSTPRCQVYGGMGAEHPLSDRAVHTTHAQVVLLDGAPAETFYSATCGGHTENVEVVFPRKRGRHLRGVPCLEAGAQRLPGGAVAAGTPLATGVVEELLPPAPGAPPQVLAARLEHLALLAGLRAPHDRLRSVTRDEVRRYLRSVLDLALDPRLLAADAAQLAALRAAPPEDWDQAARAFADDLAASALYADAGDQALDAAGADDLLFRLARHLGVLRVEPSAFLALGDDGALTLRRGGLPVRLEPPEHLATFLDRGGAHAAELSLMAGDPLTLYWHRDRLLALVQTRPPRPVEIGKRNARGRWQHTRSRAQLAASVQTRYPGFPFADFQVLSRGVSGRVGQLRLLGSDGRSLLVEGLAVRWTFDLPDTWFTARRHDGDDGRAASWSFTGRGWGHGVGLCQAGTYGMAMRGADYRQILGHYYSGITLGRMAPRGDTMAGRSPAR